jgi:putative ABC transport system permease protein
MFCVETGAGEVKQLIEVGAIDLLIAGGLVVVVIGLSMWQNLGIHRSIIIASLRTVIQLIAIGYILGWVFQLDQWPLVVVVLLIMIAVAAQTIYSQQRKSVRRGTFPGIIASLFIGSVITLVVVQYLVIGIRPWYDPQYLIPIAGMIFGNALTAMALCLSTFTDALKDNADEIEQRLALGATRRQAAARHIKSALRAALMPIINSMMVVGLVQLPGMMTGQILSGIDPVMAVKYQIVVMFMILTANGLTSVLLMNFSLNRFFTPAHQLRREVL